MDFVLVGDKRGGEMVEKIIGGCGFEKGEWVEVGNNYITGNPKIKGYIVNIDWMLEKALVQAVWNNVGSTNYRSWVNFKHLIKVEQETDPNILIDLALATRDKEWFTQLTRGME